MTTSILALALAYVFLLFLLVLAVLKSELGAIRKLLLILLAGGFYWWHFDALQGYLGWPAEERLPANFELVSRIVVEPDIKRDEDGGIYLWLRDLGHEQLVPRAFRLPYDKALHRKVDDTLKRQQQGERFVGSPARGSGSRRQDIDFKAAERDRKALKYGSDS